MGLLAIILLLAVVVGVVIMAAQRSKAPRGEEAGSNGGDVVAYLVLAMSMGVAGFSLADLASTAFPGETFVFDPAEEVATSLSALIVATPFLLYFWRRQARRRQVHPRSAGWTIYLTLIELTFMTAFVVASVVFVNGLVAGDLTSAWTGVLVFGAILVFHEYATRVTPPLSDAGELRRVVGSAIGLITATSGLIGVLSEVIGFGLEAFGVDPLELGFEPWLAMLIVGTPIWWFRWLRPWDSEPALPRLTWIVIVATAALAVCLGAATSLAVMASQFVLADTPPSGQHFANLGVALAFVLSGFLVWALHRRSLREAPRTAYRFYAYSLAAIGLTTAVSMAIALTVSTFDRTLIVGGSEADIVTFAVVVLAGAAAWLVFERRATNAEASPDIMSWPRRLYTLGFGAIFGLVAAGALIATIFVLLRRVLTGWLGDSVLTPGIFLVYSGLVSFYLLRMYAAGRAAAPPADIVAPFQVTIICSHPGLISTKFHEQARLRVLHHDGADGSITEEMADEIVAAVGNRNSYVWVDEDGFRVVPMRVGS
jgi:hypothetical protein